MSTRATDLEDPHMDQPNTQFEIAIQRAQDRTDHPEADVARFNSAL